MQHAFNADADELNQRLGPRMETVEDDDRARNLPDMSANARRGRAPRSTARRNPALPLRIHSVRCCDLFYLLPHCFLSRSKPGEPLWVCRSAPRPDLPRN